MAVLETKTISKQEVYDAYFSLCVPGKAQSAFILWIFHFFLIIGVVYHFI